MSDRVLEEKLKELGEEFDLDVEFVKMMYNVIKNYRRGYTPRMQEVLEDINDVG